MATKHELATVLAVDHNPIFLGGIVAVIAGESSLQLIGTADSAQAATEMFSSHSPHVVLMDVDLPGLSAFPAIRAMRRVKRDVVIIGLVTYEFDKAGPDALTSGASTVIFKERVGQDLLPAIFQGLRGPRGH
jgi:DNA-binding NarL/FixJ family response regulator